MPADKDSAGKHGNPNLVYSDCKTVKLNKLRCNADSSGSSVSGPSFDYCKLVWLQSLLSVRNVSDLIVWLFMQGPGKKWEHYELNKNGKPLRVPMHVQRGDLVQIISGAEKGKTGTITNVRHLHKCSCFCEDKK